MITPQSKIIIVDNNPEHLNILSKPFHLNGIGCRFYQYDVMFSNPISGIRIAFFDINLNDITNPGNNQTQIFATLADAIRTYINLDNEPFALVFWTSNKNLIENFKAYVEQRREQLHIPQPFLVAHIDKDEFINSGEDLSEKISEILSNDQINLLLDFGNQAAIAGDKTINEIYRTIPNTDSWGNSDNFKLSFDKVFSKIAESTLGLKSAKENPTKAVYSALVPIMIYYLNTSSLRNWDDCLPSLTNANRSGDLIFPDGYDFRKLNSVFHLQEDLQFKIDKNLRGIAVGFNFPSRTPWYFFITKYFADIDQESRKYFDLFIQFDTDKSSSAERDSIRGKSQFFLLEISSACDFAQNKSRLNNYMLGLITPILAKYLAKNKSEAVHLLPEMLLNNSPIQIRLNFNYVYGLFPQDKLLGEPIFRLKGEILDQISTLHASHIARIGITSFD